MVGYFVVVVAVVVFCVLGNRAHLSEYSFSSTLKNPATKAFHLDLLSCSVLLIITQLILQNNVVYNLISYVGFILPRVESFQVDQCSAECLILTEPRCSAIYICRLPERKPGLDRLCCSQYFKLQMMLILIIFELFSPKLNAVEGSSLIAYTICFIGLSLPRHFSLLKYFVNSGKSILTKTEKKKTNPEVLRGIRKASLQEEFPIDHISTPGICLAIYFQTKRTYFRKLYTFEKQSNLIILKKEL